MKTAHRTTLPRALLTPRVRQDAFGLSVLLGLCLLGTPNAWAVLGGAVTPAAASTTTTPAAVQLRSAGASTNASALYTVHTTVLDTGTTVQEYATPDGVVFAVAWQGPVLPRLDTLLGSYFAVFNTGVNATRSQRSVGTPLALNDAQLVVRSSGRMGRFSGHAYAPSLVPGGITISDVFP
ncbi:MAG: hypothetical protein RL032_1529 [Pseudomonadota bacterium]